MAAAGLADVLGRDALPLVALRLEHHLLDQAAVPVLDPGPVGQRPPRVRDAGRQLVAQLLELGQGEEARASAATGHRRMRHMGARPGGAEHRGELALQLGDLFEQGAPDGALVEQYRAWIVGQQATLEALSSRLRETAAELLRRADVAAKRIAGGIELLGDETVLEFGNRQAAPAVR